MFGLCPTCNRPVTSKDEGYRIVIQPRWRRRLFIHPECAYDGESAEESASPSNSEGETVMAQKVQVFLEDDLDGSEATETIAFSLDGTSYEIDLSDENASAFRDSMARYVGAARRAGRGTGPSRARATMKTTSDGPDPKAVRAWANENGHKVPERGRLPKDVIEAYEKRDEPKAEKSKAKDGPKAVKDLLP